MPRNLIRILVVCRPEQIGELSRSISLSPYCEVVGNVCREEDLVQVAGSVKFDLVVISHEPPYLDGREVAMRLANGAFEALTLVLMSSAAHFWSLLETKADGYHIYHDQIPTDCLAQIMDKGVWLDPTLATFLIKGPGYELLRTASVGRVDHSETLASLSTREKEVLTLLRGGLTNQEIADKLGLRVGTVKVHVKHILAKLKMDHRGQAIARFATGILSTENGDRQRECDVEGAGVG